MANIIDQIEKENMKETLPEFNIGDTVKVGVKIKEGDKEITIENRIVKRKSENRFLSLMVCGTTERGKAWDRENLEMET